MVEKELSGIDLRTARHSGLDEISDGQLLTAIEGRYDVLVTLDGGIPYQQRIAGRPFAVIDVRVPDQSPEAFRALIPALMHAIGAAKPGEVRQVPAQQGE
jgi:hypothetical protein